MSCLFLLALELKTRVYKQVVKHTRRTREVVEIYILEDYLLVCFRGPFCYNKQYIQPYLVVIYECFQAGLCYDVHIYI